MHKILYVPSLNLGVIWWRVEMYAEALVKKSERCSVHVEYFVDPSDNASWDMLLHGAGEQSDIIHAKLQGACKSFDSIIFQKIQTEQGIKCLRELKEKYPAVNFVAEIDDSIGDLSPSHHQRPTTQQNTAANHCLLSDAIITTTDYLKGEIQNIVGDKVPVHIAPNCINYDTWKYEEKEFPKADTLRIGYVGGSSHDEDIKIAYKAILPILNEYKQATFVIRSGGDRPSFLKRHPQIDFLQVAWHPSVYPQKLYDMNLDLALAPLRDTVFNRCKSPIKWVEWASLGVPVIASKVEAYVAVSKYVDYLDITLCSNDTDDWRKAILNFERKEALAMRDHGNSAEINKAARAQGLKDAAIDAFDIDLQCELLLDFLESI